MGEEVFDVVNPKDFGIDEFMTDVVNKHSGVPDAITILDETHAVLRGERITNMDEREKLDAGDRSQDPRRRDLTEQRDAALAKDKSLHIFNGKCQLAGTDDPGSAQQHLHTFVWLVNENGTQNGMGALLSWSSAPYRNLTFHLAADCSAR